MSGDRSNSHAFEFSLASLNKGNPQKRCPTMSAKTFFAIMNPRGNIVARADTRELCLEEFYNLSDSLIGLRGHSWRPDVEGLRAAGYSLLKIENWEEADER